MLYHSTTIKSLSASDCCTDLEINCGKYFIFLLLLTEGNDFSLANSTLIVDTNVTFDQSTNDSNVQVLAIDIHDDQLLEGTENFTISGTVTAPASFLAGGDTSTVYILDNDGKGKLFHTSS